MAGAIWRRLPPGRRSTSARIAIAASTAIATLSVSGGRDGVMRTDSAR